MNDNNLNYAERREKSDISNKKINYWKEINWKKTEEYVNRLQLRIVKAKLAGRNNLVKRLQYMLVHSQKIFSVLSRKKSAEWILEGDITGCFDNISHEWMIQNIQMDKKVMQQFVKAGYVYKRKLFPTTKGAIQGGAISPTLANMTLDGLEQEIHNKTNPRKKS